MNEFAIELAHDIRRGRDPLHPNRRHALRQTFPIMMDEYVQVACNVDGTSLCAWGYMHVGSDPDKRIAVIAWIENDKSGYESMGTKVKNVDLSYHGKAYWLYVKAVRRILFYYDKLMGQNNE